MQELTEAQKQAIDAVERRAMEQRPEALATLRASLRAAGVDPRRPPKTAREPVN